MKNQPTVCAIIPTYNRSGYVQETIESVLNQTRLPQEIIVVNDGSTDDTVSVVSAYGDKVTLLNKENGGKSSALNMALKNTKADYIWICDDDDVAAPAGLEALAKALDENPEAGFAFGSYKTFTDEEGERIYRDSFWKREEEPDVKINFLEDMFTFQFAMLVRRSLYKRIGPFDESLVRSQDYDMTLRLSRYAKSVYVPETVFYQRHHEGIRGNAADNFKRSNAGEKWLKYDQTFFRKIYSEYNLEEFTPTFAKSWDIPDRNRAALIQRACIMAKRALWCCTAADLFKATEVSKTSLTDDELNLLELSVTNFLSWEQLISMEKSVQNLHSCFRRNKEGKKIINALCKPLLWVAKMNFKKGRVIEGFTTLVLLFRILSLNGTLFRIGQTLSYKRFKV